MQDMSPIVGAADLATINDASVHLVLVDAGEVLSCLDPDGAAELFQQCHRVLRPGGFLLGFAEPTGYHRAAGAIEDCVAIGEFEMRDAITWSHPKGANTTKYGVADVATIIAMAQKRKSGTFVDNWIEFGVGLIDTTQTWGGKFPGNVAESPANDRVEIARHLIRVFTKPGDTVLDAHQTTSDFYRAAVAEDRAFAR